MKITWTPASGSAATLGDDAAKYAVVMESFGGAAAEQVEELFRAAAVTRYPRGNVAGEIVFVSGKSYASAAAALAAMGTEYARLNGKGTLELEEGTTKVTAANVVLRGVQRASWVGVRLWVRYVFGISTMTTTTS